MANATDIPEKRVLIVDDSKFVRTTFNRTLSASFAVREEVAGEAVPQPAATRTGTHDVLTGAFTSQSLVAEGRKHYSYAQRHGGALSVMAFRVESHAQAARDAGKEVADQLLARIAMLIKGMLRTED